MECNYWKMGEGVLAVLPSGGGAFVYFINMTIPIKKGLESPHFSAVNFNEYVQNSLLQKQPHHFVARRLGKKDETLQFSRSIKIDYHSKVTCEKIKEIISHIPGINSFISVSVTEEIS